MMKILIADDNINKINIRQYQQLRALTMWDGTSMMRKLLDKGYQEKLSMPISIALDHDNLSYLAWSMVCRHHNNGIYMQVFVPPHLRRQRIGTQLVKHLQKNHRAFGVENKEDMRCMHWDLRSEIFFDSLNVQDVGD